MIIVFPICLSQLNLSKSIILSLDNLIIIPLYTLKKEKYTKMYETLEQVMLEKKNIHPNVDFPCGPTYYMMGIDIDFYTPIFVMSRITGWSAHIMEQHASNKLIRPLSKYKGEKVREVMLLNQR